MTLEAKQVELSRPAPASEGISRQDVVNLVESATLAPSGGNCQPWRFQFEGGRLRCTHDIDRSRSFLDWNHTASYLAIGAAIENLELAARKAGIEAAITPFPVPGDAKVVCDVELRRPGAPPSVDPLADRIGERTTNRKLGPRSAPDAEALRRMDAEAARSGAKLHWITGPGELDAIGRVLGRGDKIRFLSKVMHREMMSEVRWSQPEVERTRDGIDVATLEMSNAELGAMRLLKRWGVVKTIDTLGAGAALEKPAVKSVASASAVGLLSIRGEGSLPCFLGGRALERVWLTATGLELAFQPLTILVYLFARLVEGQGEGFSPSERRELGDLWSEYQRLFQLAPEDRGLMLFRISRAGPPGVRALRRTVDDVLSFA